MYQHMLSLEQFNRQPLLRPERRHSSNQRPAAFDRQESARWVLSPDIARAGEIGGNSLANLLTNHLPHD